MTSNKVAPIDDDDGGEETKETKEDPPDLVAPSQPDNQPQSKICENDRFSQSSLGEQDPNLREEINNVRLFSPDSAGDPVPTPILTSVRFRLALVTWFGFAVLYAQRTNLSIAMVCMAKTPVHNTTGKNADVNEKCPELEHAAKDDGFDWDKPLQGQILGSFFYGYMVMQVPGGVLSERFGAKVIVAIGMFPVAVLTLVTPLLTRVHYILLIVTRVLIGLGQAVMYPAATALWGRWSPPLERSMLVGISLSGGQFGNAFALPIGGLLCATIGWESIFYVLGGFGLAFCFLWIAWVNPSPDKHKSLSEKEKIYLERTVPHVDKSSSRKSAPWGAIFTSRPVWAIIIAHTFGNYTYYMNLTQIPTYMKEVLKFNIKKNGAFSMLPYLVFWLSTMGAGILSDFIASKGVPTVIVRKVFASLGLVGPALFLVATAYMDCTQKYIAVFTLCCAVGFTGFGFASYMVNHGDLAPDFAGTLFGISNTIATLPGFVAPTIVGAITSDGTAAQWRIAFFIAAAVNVAGAVVYVLCASCELQPWSAAHAKEAKRGDGEESLDMAHMTAVYMPQAMREEEQLKNRATLRRVSTLTL
ncbi:sialin-like [Littorina saxatilis]|uniref:Major facilitator superfamily (MFS) profile domain-containing protein n=1 Tax=Littorina saxatilis TaxID=31220 RepID=A0AAN9AU64_9CAEN